MRRTVVVVDLPAFGHALAHDPTSAATAMLAQDRAWRAVIPGLRRVGDQWIHVEDEPGDALDVAFRLVREGGATAVLDEGVVVELDGELWSGAIWRAARIAANHGRVGEVLVTDLVRHRLGALPDGVGRFAAPAELSRAVGIGLWRLVDYR